jgi:hypothetical protein
MYSSIIFLYGPCPFQHSPVVHKLTYALGKCFWLSGKPYIDHIFHFLVAGEMAVSQSSLSVDRIGSSLNHTEDASTPQSSVGVDGHYSARLQHP